MSQPLIVIQARTGSTRLHNKINQMIGPKRMLDHVIDRARKTGLKWMLARPQEMPHVAENDVLGRFVHLLGMIDPQGDYNPIIRLTADCPMLDTSLIGYALNLYQQVNMSWDKYSLVGTAPEWDGLDVEVISRQGLMRSDRHARSTYDQEHVTSWLKTRDYLPIPLEGPALRWSVDDKEGLEFVREVFHLCEHCRDAVPHHTNAAGSIGGADRRPIWDLHHLERGDLVECLAYAVLMSRTGGTPYVSK